MFATGEAQADTTTMQGRVWKYSSVNSASFIVSKGLWEKMSEQCQKNNTAGLLHWVSLHYFFIRSVNNMGLTNRIIQY